MRGTNVTTLLDRGDKTTAVIRERRYLTIKEVSDYTGLRIGTLYNMVSQRRIPFVKLGQLTRFDRYELDKWLKQQSVKVGQPLVA